MPQTTRRKIRWRWLFAGLLLLLVAIFILLRLSHHSAVQRELAAIRAEGFPASPAELDKWYTHLPASENAALLVLEAIHAYSPPNADDLRQLKSSKLKPSDLRQLEFSKLKPADPIPADALALLEKHLRQNSEALARLHQAADLSQARYPIDLTRGFATLLPNLSGIKEMALFLQRDVVYHAELANPDEAFESLRSGFALSRTLRHEPILVSQLVRIATVAILLNALERALSHTEFTPEQLVALMEQLARIESEELESFLRAMAGERSCSLEAFDMGYDQLDQVSGGSMGMPEPFEVFGSALFGLRQVLGVRELDMQIYLGTMRDFMHAATNDFPELVTEFEAADRRMDRRLRSGTARLAWVSQMILPALGKAAQKEARITAHLRLARVALALERYRHANKELPAELTALVPEYLPEIPTNPFDGSPINYSPHIQGFHLAFTIPLPRPDPEILEFQVSAP